MSRVAIHEAGHCVIAIFYNLLFKDVNIKSRVNSTAEKNNNNKIIVQRILGSVSFINFDKIDQDKKNVLILSGAVSEAVLIKNKFEELINARQTTNLPKFDLIQKIKKFFSGSDDYDEYINYHKNESKLENHIKETIPIVESNWQQITEVAKELENKKSMNYNEVKHIVSINKYD